MKAFIVLAVVACASANPGLVLNGLGLTLAGHQTLLSGPAVYSAPIAAPVVAPALTSSQYHAQDELGQFSYGYAGGPSAKSELKTIDGVTRGGYNYVDANGVVQSVSYVSDPVNGFRVAATNLPVAPAVPEAPKLVGPAPVQDTPEVAAARAAHEKAINEARAKSAEAAPAPAPAAAPSPAPEPVALAAAAPEPVQDTPEVALAKAEHAKAVEEAKARNAAAPLSRRKRGIIAAPLAYSAIAPAAVTYTAVAAPAVIAAPAVREATLTKVINTPGHAVSYRVD